MNSTHKKYKIQKITLKPLKHLPYKRTMRQHLLYVRRMTPRFGKAEASSLSSENKSKCGFFRVTNPIVEIFS